MTVFCVIVTYSDRFHLLEQVIRSCINEGVDKIIVVDNNSYDDSTNMIARDFPEIKLIKNTINYIREEDIINDLIQEGKMSSHIIVYG